MSLEAEFDLAMVQIYQRAWKECHYPAKRFLKMIGDDGGLRTAQRLLAKGESSGFVELWECGRLDLTMEALILTDRFASLFTADERKVAFDRLNELGYKFPDTK